MKINNSSMKVDLSSSNNSISTSDVLLKDSAFPEKKAQPTVKAVSQINEYDMVGMPVSERVVIEAIQKANKAISGGNRRFEFSIHEKTNEIMVKVFDSETNELVREIPNEKVLDMVARMCEMAGILVDERG